MPLSTLAKIATYPNASDAVMPLTAKIVVQATMPLTEVAFQQGLVTA